MTTRRKTLSDKERESLADMVSPADLTPTIRRTIEAGIRHYREETEREKRAVPVRAATIKRLQHARTAAERARLAVRKLGSAPALRSADDDALIKSLDDAIRRWTAAAEAARGYGHRHQDYAILDFGVEVLTVLAPELEKSELPIDVGRGTAIDDTVARIVEVIGRVCRLARGRADRALVSHDKEITRSIIQRYRSTPAGKQFFSRRAFRSDVSLPEM